MRALLHDLLLSFQSDDSHVLAGWHKLFDLEITAASALPPDAAVEISLITTVCSLIPQPPAGRPSYSEQSTGSQDRHVRFYETQNGGILDLARPAQIEFNFDDSRAHITLTRDILDTGNLEDITMIALAPFLRRRGFYMAHAFAVAGKSALLLSGPSGSGKTTTGLALVDAGWSYLANDVTLLHRGADDVYAYQSPGAINLHPRTLAILPTFHRHVTLPDTPEASGKYVLARCELLAQAQCGLAAPVSAILFPAITKQQGPSLHPIARAIGMARLVEEGVDQWDQKTYAEHLNLLTRASQQVTFFDLHLPHSGPGDLKPVTDLLERRFGAGNQKVISH